MEAGRHDAPPPVEAGGRKIVRLDALRALIAEKFPARRPAQRGARFSTGLAALDDPSGGLRKGALTEFSGALGSGGLFIEAMLAAAERQQCFAGLVDAARAFDPCGANYRLLRRLLWVACDHAAMAVKAADLLLRDGNLPLLLLDLQGAPARELQRIPASTWHRFHRIAGQAPVVFVVLTTAPMIEGASCRIAADNRWRIDDLARPREDLRLGLRVFERGAGVAPESEPPTEAAGSRKAARGVA